MWLIGTQAHRTTDTVHYREVSNQINPGLAVFKDCTIPSSFQLECNSSTTPTKMPNERVLGPPRAHRPHHCSGSSKPEFHIRGGKDKHVKSLGARQNEAVCWQCHKMMQVRTTAEKSWVYHCKKCKVYFCTPCSYLQTGINYDESWKF